jgi:hypothetical protein
MYVCNKKDMQFQSLHHLAFNIENIYSFAHHMLKF